MEPLQRVDRFGQGLTGVMGGLGSVTTQQGRLVKQHLVQSPFLLQDGISSGIGAFKFRQNYLGLG